MWNSRWGGGREVAFSLYCVLSRDCWAQLEAETCPRDKIHLCPSAGETLALLFNLVSHFCQCFQVRGNFHESRSYIRFQSICVYWPLMISKVGVLEQTGRHAYGFAGQRSSHQWDFSSLPQAERTWSCWPPVIDIYILHKLKPLSRILVPTFPSNLCDPSLPLFSVLLIKYKTHRCTLPWPVWCPFSGLPLFLFSWPRLCSLKT